MNCVQVARPTRPGRTPRTARRLARIGIAVAAAAFTIVPLGGVATAVDGDPSQWEQVIGDPSDGEDGQDKRSNHEYEGQVAPNEYEHDGKN